MQQLNELQSRLRTGIDVGKWRARVLKLGYDRSTRVEKQWQAIAALGTLTWEQRIEHPSYADLFAQLLDLEQQRTATQASIVTLETTIEQEETRKRQLTAEGAARLHEAEQHNRAADPQLAQPVGEQPGDAASTHPPATSTPPSAHPDTSYATRRLDNTDLPDTVDGEPAVPTDTDLPERQTEQQQALTRTNETLVELRQEMQRKRSQLADIERQFPALQQRLGEAVNRARPQHDSLIEHYARLDTLDQEIGHLSNEIDTLNQQIAAAGTSATKTLYWLAGGTVVAVVALLLLVSNGLNGLNGLGLSGSGGGVSERQIRADLVGAFVATPLLYIDPIWEIASNDIQSLKILERRTDRDAKTEYIKAQMTLANDILTVNAQAELTYKQYEQGWRVTNIHVPESERQLTLIRNTHEPSLDRMGNDIKRVMHGQVLGGCNHPVNLRHSKAYGGISDDGVPEVWYELTGNACRIRGTWVLHYLWNGRNWESNRAVCLEGNSASCIYR